VCGFLVGLDQITAQTAARLCYIDWEVSCDVVLFSDVALLDELEEPWKTDAAREPEAQASSIDWRETIKVMIVVETVMGSAECDAWAAACEGTGIDRVKASEERARPAVWSSGWLCDNLWLVQGILESSDPGVDIISINGSGGSGGSWLSRHVGYV